MFEMIWVLDMPSEDGYTVIIKISNNTQIGSGIWTKSVLWGSKCAKKSSWTVNARMGPCFHVAYTKSYPYHSNAAAEMESSDQTIFF